MGWNNGGTCRLSDPFGIKLDKTTGSMTFYNKANSGLPDNYVRAIAIDRQGNKWIGTNGGGLQSLME